MYLLYLFDVYRAHISTITLAELSSRSLNINVNTQQTPTSTHKHTAATFECGVRRGAVRYTYIQLCGVYCASMPPVVFILNPLLICIHIYIVKADIFVFRNWYCWRGWFGNRAVGLNHKRLNKKIPPQRKHSLPTHTHSHTLTEINKHTHTESNTRTYIQRYMLTWKLAIIFTYLYMYVRDDCMSMHCIVYWIF